jgi:hypothetical protein
MAIQNNNFLQEGKGHLREFWQMCQVLPMLSVQVGQVRLR